MSNGSSRALLERLIGFPTVSRDSNLEMIEFIRHYLGDLGVRSELFYNAERTKANLFATIGPDAGGGIVLSGHTDVVPVDGQPWTVEPFRLSEQDGRLYGRGTADMKGFIASVLAAVPAFLARDLRVPVHLAFSYDEEVGCLGVRPMLAELAKRAHKPALCLIGEPTVIDGMTFSRRTPESDTVHQRASPCLLIQRSPSVSRNSSTRLYQRPAVCRLGVSPRTVFVWAIAASMYASRSPACQKE